MFLYTSRFISDPLHLGPPVWNCAAGGTTLPVATATDTATLPPVSTIPVSSTEVATTPTGPLASLYGQCGGENWTGPTFVRDLLHILFQEIYLFQCSQGTCTASNQYYSMCSFIAPTFLILSSFLFQASVYHKVFG